MTETWEMLPGRELDCVVARQVLGKRAMRGMRNDPGAWWIEDADGTTWDSEAAAWNYTRFPHYSSNVRDAWTIVEWLCARKLTPCLGGLTNGGFRCSFRHVSDFAIGYWQAEASTASLAICWAALRATWDDTAAARTTAMRGGIDVPGLP